MSWWHEVPSRRLVPDPGQVAVWGWRDLGMEGVTEEREAGPAVPDPLALAREEAFLDGLREGAHRERERLAGAISALERATAELEGDRRRRSDEAEERVRALSLAVARVLVDRELERDAGLLLHLIRKGLSIFPPDEAVTIRLHPRDLLALVSPEDGGSEFPQLAPGLDIRWEADAALAPGDVRLEAGEQVLDGGILPCLERIWNELRVEDETHE